MKPKSLSTAPASDFRRSCSRYPRNVLVEDDAAHAEIVRRSLAELRIDSRLIHLEDGQAGLDYLLEEGPRAQPVDHPRPDHILLDL